MIIDTLCTSRLALPPDVPRGRNGSPYECTLDADHEGRHEARGSEDSGGLVVWNDGDQWAREVTP